MQWVSSYEWLRSVAWIAERKKFPMVDNPQEAIWACNSISFRSHLLIEIYIDRRGTRGHCAVTQQRRSCGNTATYRPFSTLDAGLRRIVDIGFGNAGIRIWIALAVSERRGFGLYPGGGSAPADGPFLQHRDWAPHWSHRRPARRCDLRGHGRTGCSGGASDVSAADRGIGTGGCADAAGTNPMSGDSRAGGGDHTADYVGRIQGGLGGQPDHLRKCGRGRGLRRRFAKDPTAAGGRALSLRRRSGRLAG